MSTMNFGYFCPILFEDVCLGADSFDAALELIVVLFQQKYVLLLTANLIF